MIGHWLLQSDDPESDEPQSQELDDPESKEDTLELPESEQQLFVLESVANPESRAGATLLSAMLLFCEVCHVEEPHGVSFRCPLFQEGSPNG